MTRRARIWLIALGVLAVLLLAAGFFVRSLLSPERFTAILQQAVGNVGLVLKLDGAAEAVLFPSPAVEIHGARVYLPGEPMLLRADRLRLVVPWRSLLGGAPAITRLDIEAPWVDLAQVREWMAQLPTDQDDGPPRLPAIDAGMRIRDGRFVSGDQLLLANVAIDAGSLHMGHRFTLDIAAETAEADTLQFHLSATPLQNQDRLRLENLVMTASSGESTRLNLAGEIVWHGGNRLNGELEGELELAETSYQLSLALAPPTKTELLPLDVRVDSGTTHIALSMSPQELAQWWQTIRDTDAAQLPLPPVVGTASLQQLDIGALHIEGLQVQSSLPTVSSSKAPAAVSAPVLPAAPSTSNAPATAATAAEGPA